MYKDKATAPGGFSPARLILLSFTAVIIFTLLVLFTLVPPHGTSSSSSTSGTLRSLLSSKPKPQRLVFVDFGANRGDSYRVFMQEPNTKYNYTYAKPENRHFKEFEAHLFEANPVFNVELVNTKQEFTKRGYGEVKIYPSTIVYTKDTIVPFFLDTVNTANDFWGSSILSSHRDSKASGGVSVDLRAMDVARFLLESFSPEDFVVVKMDIEGAEYDVIPHLAKMKAYVNIDYMYVEYHTFAIEEEGNRWKDGALQEALREMRRNGVELPVYDSSA
ncbi:hypothetical protein HDV05_007704 [Chytridiales sp. JEL 0842]|nr:hypothetical protein HDV05_007704 [Chytridiales sp. JEL 0842]